MLLARLFPPAFHPPALQFTPAIAQFVASKLSLTARPPTMQVIERRCKGK